MEIKVMENSNNLSNSTVQDYVVNNYGSEVLNRIYSEVSLNEWDYFISIDSENELKDYIESFL